MEENRISHFVLVTKWDIICSTLQSASAQKHTNAILPDLEEPSTAADEPLVNE